MISLRRAFAALVVLTVLSDTTAQRRYDDFSDLPPGPYCGASRCCPGRQDECSAPILGTLCYCDDFCNQTRVEDCCPDYWTYCRGVPVPTPAPVPTPRPGEITEKYCIYDGERYRVGQSVKKNCNLCKCELIGNTPDFLCERNGCIQNHLLIETVNRERRYAWTASNYSKFWGRTLAEGIATRLGTLQPERLMNPMRKIYNPDDLPRQFDSYLEWPNYITGIQDQGDCAASWAISTAAVASDRFGIVSKGQEAVQLSAQNLVSCDRKGQQSCKGGYLDKAWTFIRIFGLVTEECYPYVGYDQSCKIDIYGDLRRSGCRLPQNGRVSKYMVSPAYRLGNETDIMYEILTSGPVQATMLVRNDFFSYGGGIYEHTDIVEDPRTGYLSVRIVGWGEEETRHGLKKFWRVANSWGKDWGENGFFRIVKGRDESQIESFVIGTWPQVIMRNIPRESVREPIAE